MIEFLYITILILLFSQGLVEKLLDLRVPVWAALIILMLIFYFIRLPFIKKNMKIPAFLKIAIILTLITLVKNLLADDLLKTLESSRGPIMGIIVAWIISGICINKIKINRLIQILTYAGILSGIVAIIQFASRGTILAWWTKETILRPAGLFNYSIPFTYALCCVIPLILAKTLHEKKYLKNRIYFAPFLIISAGLLLSLTRSAILGVTVAGIYITFKIRRIKIQNIFLIIILCMTLIFSFPLIDRLLYGERTERSNISYEDTFSGRVALAYAYTKLSLNNPWGISRVSTEVMEEYQKEAYFISSHLEGALWVKYGVAVHNNFILMNYYYGIIGGMGLIFFYTLLYMSLSRSELVARSLNKDYLWLAIGLKGVIISYIINSFFHNNGPFLTDVLIWFYIGLAGSISHILEYQLKLTKRYDYEKKDSYSTAPQNWGWTR